MKSKNHILVGKLDPLSLDFKKSSETAKLKNSSLDQKILNLIANQRVPLTLVASFFESSDRLEVHHRIRSLLSNEDLELTEDWMLELPSTPEVSKEKKGFLDYAQILYENFCRFSSDSLNVEEIRESLDTIWINLTKEERELTGILSEDYYELFQKSEVEKEKTTSSEKFLELFYEKYDPKNRETLLELHKWAQDHTFESWAVSLLVRGFLWLKYDGMREIANQFLDKEEVKGLSDSMRIPFFSVSSEYYNKNSMVVYDRAVREGRVSLMNKEGKIYAAISVPRDKLPVCDC